MKLLIVESPSKAKTIEKYLGNDFIVRASIGHIRDLPKSNKDAVDIKNNFKPKYIVDTKKEKILREIKDLANKSEMVYLATDPDREGEAIAWHIKDELKLDNAKRITFNEITESAIKEALKHPRDIDINLKEAQEARRVLDRLVGYDLSQIVWKKVRYGLSAGRVQSPALRILVEREKEIQNFVPEEYFVLEGDFETIGKAKESKKYKLKLDCDEIPKQKERAIEIKNLGEKSDWIIKDIKQSEIKKNPNAPFITSTLQQAASTRLGFSPSKTMSLAQKLYEKGLITYMRTDSTNISKEALKEIAQTIEKKYGKDFIEIREYKTKSKNAQEAHEAIRPTHQSVEKAGSTDDEKKLYELIWQRTIASQMRSAKIIRTKIIASSQNLKLPTFSINGSVVKDPGFLLADPNAKGEDIILPKLEINTNLKVLNINIQEKLTEPPSRYTEAGLIKELETRGIGRPSTYASIISTIEERGYVEKQNKTLFPTPTGIVVSDFLSNNFSKYVSDNFTAKMEDELDEIAKGKEKYADVLNKFYIPFSQEIENKKDIEKVTNLRKAPVDVLCPKCNSEMVEKLSKTGTFYSCVKYPECDGARKIDGSIIEAPKSLGKTCPKCQKGELVEKDGRYGKFITCSTYPKCKYIEKSEEEKLKANTGVKCNHCADGYMEERRGRFGIFYSCSNYPDCKHAIKAKPTGEFCNLCKEMIMEGTKTIPNRCSNKLCPMHNPHKIQK